MEKLRSLSWKSSKFLVISLTLSFSLVLLSFLSFWVMRRASPLIHQEAYMLLNTPSLSLSLNSDSSVFNLANSTNLNITQLKRSQISSRFGENSSIEVAFSKSEEVGSRRTKVGESSTDFGRNLSVSRVKVVKLGSTHLRKPHNSSGFMKSSIFKEEVSEILDGKVDVSSKEKRELNLTSIGKVDEEIKEKRGKDCDVSKGRWVFDESYPLYTNFSCPFIDEGFNCQGNGRVDKDYMKWRWQPQDCDIPRFNATNMLELIRGKRLVFAGDSINRNQWESLLCLLMGAVKDPTKVYETRGRRITKTRGVYSYRFVDYQCTVEFYVSHFLVRESKARMGNKRKETLRIDSIDRDSRKWRGADILIFNTGNWWTHFKTKAGINYYQDGNQVYPHLDALTAYRKALSTWATWVDKFVDARKTHVFFRSTAPAHFRGGQWNTGGHCREARKPLNEMYINDPEKDVIAQEVISSMKTPVTFMNITGLSSYRIDGHPSKYGKSPGKKGSPVEDCSHWCLPGVPDTWNEMIYHQLLLKQQKVYTSL
ncbi:protein trichome birefringence-like 6 [Beta vulgaris subsp. vulgaris]|uniref:protein trichome birefringence-like 6 n=1 Tax=Beta vulgaris subsp. vulgaris TaxID=3555 RepID=UPI002036CEA1|nr:protein trichome birefringence-like 6 [Beta vulgaris subsp. vulgaris]